MDEQSKIFLNYIDNYLKLNPVYIKKCVYCNYYAPKGTICRITRYYHL